MSNTSCAVSRKTAIWCLTPSISLLVVSLVGEGGFTTLKVSRVLRKQSAFSIETYMTKYFAKAAEVGIS